MDITVLISIVTILITLSVASERLVEIIKGFFPQLSEEYLEGSKEAWRKAKVNILAVICGIFTAFLASPVLSGIFKNLYPEESTCKLALGFLNLGKDSPCGFDFSINGFFLIFALGLLASGGSSLWNSILEYLLKIKDLKKSEARRSTEMRRIEVERARVELEIARVRLPKPE